MSKLIKLLKARAQAEAAANGGVLLGQLPPLDRSPISYVREDIVSFLSLKPERALSKRKRNSGDHREARSEDGPGGGSTVRGRWRVVEGGEQEMDRKVGSQEMD